MTTRQFDPVLSAALRNELESLADAQEPTPARGFLHTLRKPQVWISIVTAVVLVAATVGVLQVTRPTESQPAERSKVVDPLRWITEPSSSGYVAREVQTLLHVSATGPGVHDLAVPAGVTGLQVYLNCAPSGQSGVGLDGDGKVSGACSRNTGSSYGIPITAGTHEVEVAIGKRTDYTLLITATPPATIATGALLDPLSAVRDLRNPDALTSDTTPLVQAGGAAGGVTSTRFPVPTGVTRMRAYLVCARTSATTEMRIGTQVVTGCMNSIAHWFDFRTPNPSVPVSVTSSVAWSLLVVRAPKGAKDSPANTTLPYPDAPGTLLAEARGAGAPASGTYRRPGTAIVFTVTCRGTGWLEIETGDGGTNTRQTPCSALQPQTVGFAGEKDASRQKWSVIPHGDISWTFQLSTDD